MPEGLKAAIEAFDGLSHLPALFGDMSEIPGPGLGGAIIKADIAVHPLLALSALACATATVCCAAAVGCTGRHSACASGSRMGSQDSPKSGKAAQLTSRA